MPKQPRLTSQRQFSQLIRRLTGAASLYDLIRVATVFNSSNNVKRTFLDQCRRSVIPQYENSPARTQWPVADRVKPWSSRCTISMPPGVSFEKVFGQRGYGAATPSRRSIELFILTISLVVLVIFAFLWNSVFDDHCKRGNSCFAGLVRSSSCGC